MKDQESNIDYIQRLSVMLDRVVKNGGLQEENVQQTLLTHFKSTFRDERVANAIHVKFTSDSPPSQLQLIKGIRRTEEDFRCVPQKRDSKKAFAHGRESSILTNIQSQMQMLQQLPPYNESVSGDPTAARSRSTHGGEGCDQGSIQSIEAA